MNISNKKAVSILEYILLFIIVLAAIFIMKNYIQRGLFGTWAKTGQSFAFGRQYDPQKSVDCSFDDVSNLWYDRNCLENNKNYSGCNNVPADYCADGSTCGAVITGQCQDGSTCGSGSCEENIIKNMCSTVNLCRQTSLYMVQ